MITIFTPTYNRAYSLPSLYASLCAQTNKDFEWLIVDDGSTDATEELVKRFKALQLLESSSFEIRYFKQENRGKHCAINYGVAEAAGELFFIVDSDDKLTNDATEWIQNCFDGIREDEKFAGISGIRITPDGNRIGGSMKYEVLDTDAVSLRFRDGIDGDMAEIYRLDILRKFPFPVFGNERFCPEALVWNRIAKEYKLRYLNHGIYVCEYLPDGLTAKIVKIRHESPMASMSYYAELFHCKIPCMQKIKAAINFWRFAKCGLFSQVAKMQMLNPLSLICAPIGWVYAMIDQW